jgi:lysophospholipase
MFGINTSPASPALTENLAKTMANIGWGKSYIFGGRAKAWKIRFADNPLTSDRQRFNRNIGFFENIPELQLGSPTFKWLAESMVAGRMILAINASSTPATIPMVVIQGEKDRVVTAAAQNQFCQSIPSCTLHIIAGAKHELLMEEDDKRNQVVAVITRFLKQHSSA